MDLILSSIIKKKCKKCEHCNKEFCKYKQVYINLHTSVYCDFDQRKMCIICDNYDIKKQECKIKLRGKHKSPETLRICKDFNIKG